MKSDFLPFFPYKMEPGHWVAEDQVPWQSWSVSAESYQQGPRFGHDNRDRRWLKMGRDMKWDMEWALKWIWYDVIWEGMMYMWFQVWKISCNMKKAWCNMRIGRVWYDLMIYHLYIAFWGDYMLPIPPFKGTRNNHWTVVWCGTVRGLVVWQSNCQPREWQLAIAERAIPRYLPRNSVWWYGYYY